jgi:hypothetical protein
MKPSISSTPIFSPASDALLQDVNGPPQAEQDRADRLGAFT